MTDRDEGGATPGEGHAGGAGADAAAARGGCLKLGWGWLPAWIGPSLALPAGLWL